MERRIPRYGLKISSSTFTWLVEIVSTGHVDVEEIVLDPDRGVCCAIVGFDVYGFKPFRDLMIHYFVSEAQGVCGASVSGDFTTQFG